MEIVTLRNFQMKTSDSVLLLPIAVLYRVGSIRLSPREIESETLYRYHVEGI